MSERGFRWSIEKRHRSDSRHRFRETVEEEDLLPPQPAIIRTNALRQQQSKPQEMLYFVLPPKNSATWLYVQVDHFSAISSDLLCYSTGGMLRLRSGCGQSHPPCVVARWRASKTTSIFVFTVIPAPTVTLILQNSCRSVTRIVQILQAA